jgi:hypothetical protein
MCQGSVITLTDPAPGGTWLKSNANANITGPGIILGVTPGVDSIFYAVTNTCGTNVANEIISIYPIPVVLPITGPNSQCSGTIITLSDASSGGTWSSSNAIVASVGSGTGIVTGVAAGSATITYTVINTFGCGTGVTTTDTVNFTPGTSRLPV